jgi:hypothetical protein
MTVTVSLPEAALPSLDWGDGGAMIGEANDARRCRDAAAALVAMLSVAAAADLPRKEPPPVAAAPTCSNHCCRMGADCRA